MSRLFILVLSSFLLSCAQSPISDENSETNQENVSDPTLTQVQANQMIHQRMMILANKLFSTAQGIVPSKPVAVGTFLPVSQLGEKLMPTDNLIGHQVQESLITLGTQAGLNVIEFKTMPSVKLQSNYDIMLSRNIEELSNNFNAYYYLTGTYTEQTDSYIVNARIIELKTQRVVAAATDYIPIDIMSTQRKVGMKNNMLYRNSY
ncbi:FlgO family outer membrane protein [Thalassotalea piscium]